MMLLAPHLGRDAAHKLLEEAARRSAGQSRRLAEVLSEMPEVTRCVSRDELLTIEDPERYLGAAGVFRERLLNASLPSSRSRKE